MYVDPDDNFICAQLRAHGVWEPKVREAIIEHLKPGWTFLDLGAHIGYFSLVAAHHGAGTVISVEPMPKAFEILSENRLFGHVPGISVNAAVSDRGGTTYMRAMKGNTGASYTSDHGLQVNVIPARMLHEAEFIKMDIEGDEYKVLKSAPHLLENAKVIIFEYSENQLMRNSGIHGQALMNLFKENGFELIQLHNKSYQDWIAIKQ